MYVCTFNDDGMCVGIDSSISTGIALKLVASAFSIIASKENGVS